MTKTAVALSWSGGKDSAFALHRLNASTDYEVTALITSVTRDYDRISIHGVRRTLLDLQARSLGLPLFEVALDPKSSDAAYQEAFLATLAELKNTQPEVTHVAFGDLYLREIRAYRDLLLADTGLQGLYPLWDEPTKDLAECFIASGFRATLVCTDNTQLDPSFSGRSFDRAMLADLPAAADPCGENGEFHTFVHDGPIFRAAIPIAKGETVAREGRFTYCDLMAM